MIYLTGNTMISLLEASYYAGYLSTTLSIIITILFLWEEQPVFICDLFKYSIMSPALICVTCDDKLHISKWMNLLL